MKNLHSVNDDIKKQQVSVHAGHRERLRKLFMDVDESSLSDQQIFELLLFYAIPRADTNVTAHNLLNTFGSISGILNARFDHLKNVEGIGDISAILIKLIPERMRRANIKDENRYTIVSSLDEIGKHFIKLFAYEEKEVASLVLINKNRRIISTHRLKFMLGKNGDSALDEILSICVNARPHTVVLAHLHPDGCKVPSRSDELFTYNLKNSLEALRIMLMEHFVITHDGYTRMVNALDYNFKDTFGL